MDTVLNTGLNSTLDIKLALRKRIESLKTPFLKNLAKEIVGYRSGTFSILFDAILDVLIERMPEQEFVFFAAQLEKILDALDENEFETVSDEASEGQAIEMLLAKAKLWDSNPEREVKHENASQDNSGSESRGRREGQTKESAA